MINKKETSLSDTEVICTHFGDHVPCYSQPVYLKQAVKNAVDELKELFRKYEKDWQKDWRLENIETKIDKIFGAKLTQLTERSKDGK